MGRPFFNGKFCISLGRPSGRIRHRACHRHRRGPRVVFAGGNPNRRQESFTCLGEGSNPLTAHGLGKLFIGMRIYCMQIEQNFLFPRCVFCIGGRSGKVDICNQRSDIASAKLCSVTCSETSISLPSPCPRNPYGDRGLSRRACVPV